MVKLSILEENHGASEKTPNLKKKRMVGRVKTSRGLVEKRQPWRAVCLGEARGWDDGFV